MAEEAHFSSIKPLMQGMWCGDFLTNEEVVGKFYRLLVEHKLESKLSENEKYQVDQYIRKYNLNSYTGAPKFFGKAANLDTTVTILANKRLILNNLQYPKTEFLDGDSTYLQINIVQAKRKNPKYNLKLTILLPGSEIPQVMLLDDNNCIYNPKSPAFDSKHITISGKLVRNEFGLYILIDETELPNRHMSIINKIWISPEKLKL